MNVGGGHPSKNLSSTKMGSINQKGDTFHGSSRAFSVNLIIFKVFFWSIGKNKKKTIDTTLSQKGALL